MQRPQIMRPLLIVILLLAGFMVTPALARAADGDSLAAVARLYEAFNAGDLDGLVAVYANNAVVEAGPFATYNGTLEIRGWAEPQMEANVHFDYVVLGEDEETNTVTVQSTYTSDDFEIPLEATEEFVVQDNIVLSHKWIPSEETMAFLVAVQEQARRARRTPEDVINAAYTAFNIRDLDRFLEQYAESAVVDVSPYGAHNGSEEIRAWVKPQMEARARLTYEILDVQDGLVTVLSTYTSDGFEYALDATEVYEVKDGQIVRHVWTPDEKTMELLDQAALGGRAEASTELAGASNNLAGTYGLTVEGVFYVIDEGAGEMTGLPFAMLGTLVADGEGFVTRGTRTLNSQGDIQTDTITGSYVPEEDGRLSLTINAFEDGKYVSMEEYACYVTETGDQFECLMTEVLQVDIGPDPVSFPVMAIARGLRLQELDVE